MNKKKPIDILQGKFHYFTGDVELDDENEDLTDRVYSGETIVGGKKKMYWTEDGWKEGEKEKYDFEGSLDDFEIWLKNWSPNEYKDLDKDIEKLEKSFKNWDTELKERNMTIKLKPLIKDGILKEKLDTEIKKSVNELGDLSSEIDKLKNKLEPLTKRYGEIVEKIIPVVEELGDENILTKKYVFRIIKKGFDRKTVSYRSGFLESLQRVNKQTRLVLERILKETEKLSYVKPRFSISTVEGVGDTLKKWVKRFSGLVKKILPSLKQIKNGNKELKRFMVKR